MKTRTALLRGSTDLVSHGFLRVLDTVQMTHLAIGDTVARFVPGAGVVNRATAWVYGGIRGVGRAAGTLAGHAVTALERRAGAVDSHTLSRDQLNWLSALNGAIGDRLASSGNALAIDMALCRDGAAVAIDASLSDAIATAGGTLIVLVHGLGMNDQQWRDAEGSDFGERLERDLGGFAVRLRYNSGRSIAANGAEFAAMLQSIHSASAGRLQRIVLIGHSMGGLVSRSACIDAARREQSWLSALSDVVCLGSPHRGAPLERFGDSLAGLLAATPYTRGLAELAEARSSGVKDLRHGQLQPLTPAIHAISLPAHIRWFLGAAVLSARSEGVRASLLGDGLVPLRSALAQTTRGQRTPLLPPAQRRVFHRLGHLDLVDHPQVYAQLRRWLAGDSR